ncbi:MAG: PAQR family membrane homeostasis protein TrhA [Aureliella sp.]
MTKQPERPSQNSSDAENTPDPQHSLAGGDESTYLSREDELANVITHTLGIVLSLFAAAYFWSSIPGENFGLRVSCLVFCSCMTLVYTFSTLSHAIEKPDWRNRLRAWDQGTIYLLIIGTYSPFIWEGTEGSFRVGFFAVAWGIALLGFYSKVFATHRINAVATLTYLALGWLPALPLIATTPWICFVWMLAGGVCYSVGVLFLKQSSRIRFSHAVWHIFVMLGSACHVYAVSLLA